MKIRILKGTNTIGGAITEITSKQAKIILDFGTDLSTYCNLPNQKVIELLGFLSDDQIRMCTGTIGNTVKSFSKKSKSIRESLKKQILKEPVINEDETPTSVNGKIMSAIGVFTKEISFLDAFANRKLESFEEMGMLNKYIGTVCHDDNNNRYMQKAEVEYKRKIDRYI